MIEKITLKIGEQVVDLTLEQARELKNELEALFPEPIWKYVPQPYPVPVNPWRDQYIPYPTAPGWPILAYGAIGAGNQQ